MTDAKPSFITLRGLHEAGEGIAFAVAELDPGRFWVLGRETADGPFQRWHDAPIRREGAEALADYLADMARKAQARLADPTLHETDRQNAEEGYALLVAGNPGSDRLALDFDAAAALLPLLADTPDAWGLAMRIAEARPWQMPGRDRPHDRRVVHDPRDLDSEIPF